MNTSTLLTVKPPRIAFALVAIAAVAAWLLPAQPKLFNAPLIVAMVLAAAGFLVMMAGWWQFRDREVLICPTEPTRVLITDGVYRFTRNPMYLGMLLMLVGLATWAGDLSFYIAAALFFLVMDRVFCPYEEEKLHRSFGSAYLDYRLRVRRWL